MKRTETMAEMVEIELDRPRHIVLDSEALLAIEEAIPGANTLDLEFWKQISTKRARIILWAGLLYDDPALKLEDMKNVLRGQAFGLLIEKLLEAWGIARPEKDSKEGASDPQEPEATQSPSAGLTSGPSPSST